MAQKFDLHEALKKAQETGEVFLASMSREQLEKSGFDSSVFGEFCFAEIYLQWFDDEFVIKYVFDGDPSNTYYERVRDVGSDVFDAIIESYIGGE